MALRKHDQTAPQLTKEEVLHLRERYFLEYAKYRELEEETGFSLNTIRNAVHGRGMFYSSVQDDISIDIKKARRSPKCP